MIWLVLAECEDEGLEPYAENTKTILLKLQALNPEPIQGVVPRAIRFFLLRGGGREEGRLQNATALNPRKVPPKNMVALPLCLGHFGLESPCCWAFLGVLEAVDLYDASILTLNPAAWGACKHGLASPPSPFGNIKSSGFAHFGASTPNP